MKRIPYLKILLPTTALAVALGLGVMATGATESPADTPATAAAPSAIPVDVTVMKAAPVRLWTEFSARLQAVDAVDLRPQVDGAIVEVRFTDGERVKKGDVLFVIDPRPYEAAVTQATAELAAARDRHRLAGKELERAKSLIKTSAISERVLDERTNAYAVSKSDVDAAGARLARTRIDLDHAFVKAPIAGRVSRAEITIGNLVQAGSNAPTLTTIVSDREIYADFEVDEKTYVAFVRRSAKNVEAERGIPVRLEVGGLDGIEIEGHIHTFDNRLDPATGTIRARALFSNEQATLLPGMFARVKLGSATAQSALMLTDKAILTDQDRKFVYVMDADGKAAYRQISVGATVEGRRVVTTGLAPGDRVITSSLMMLRPGAPVMTKAAAAKAAATGTPAPKNEAAAH
jgi:multidrug efflux system membrane fusion protein